MLNNRQYLVDNLNSLLSHNKYLQITNCKHKPSEYNINISGQNKGIEHSFGYG